MKYIFSATAVMTFSCEHCGEALQIIQPDNPVTLAALLRAFEDCHAECLLDKKEAAGD